MKRWANIRTCIVWLLLLTTVRIECQNLPQMCAGSKGRYSVKGLKNSIFKWDVQGGKIVSNYNDSVDILWGTDEGIYTITVVQHTFIGCISRTVYGHVLVSSESADLKKEASICEGESYTIKTKKDYQSITWNTGSRDSFIVANQSGYYIADIITASGCNIKDSILLVVHPKPSFSIGKDTTVCEGQTVLLDPGIIANNYQWSTGETTPVIYTSTTGIVWARVTDNNGCTATDSILIKPCATERITDLIPNAFTPNNDNDNDTWRIDFLAKYPEASVSIYNRWGQLVYKTEKNYPPQGWDGTSYGRPVPISTYYYIIDLKDGTKPTIGSVNLIR